MTPPSKIVAVDLRIGAERDDLTNRCRGRLPRGVLGRRHRGERQRRDHGQAHESSEHVAILPVRG